MILPKMGALLRSGTSAFALLMSTADPAVLQLQGCMYRQPPLCCLTTPCFHRQLPVIAGDPKPEPEADAESSNSDDEYAEVTAPDEFLVRCADSQQ